MPTDKKGKNQNPEHTIKLQPDGLNELKEMGADMAILKNIGAEVAQLRVNSPNKAQTQYLVSLTTEKYIPPPQFHYPP